ncbi:hypothetical protein SAMN05216377_115172 [Pseudonocardia oroxyli]|uniref:Uncharacterized protein n=1 Tax=Pseudonocardia oroxyli TaxID=366584 RepID=A0A1G7XEB1_PSEOR|nr:hypothetical protein SAMN05216377_115172 [Pseudonocardia oroxyli]
MGGRGRYDRDVVVDKSIVAEAAAYTTIAKLLDARRGHYR